MDDPTGGSALVRASLQPFFSDTFTLPPVSSRPLNRPPPFAQQMLEGNIVNVAITSPAATLAMGLVFLKTNDAAAAGRIVVPSTYHALDSVRPDLLLLRVVARALILWDSVEPTKCAFPAFCSPVSLRPVSFLWPRGRKRKGTTCAAALTALARAPTSPISLSLLSRAWVEQQLPEILRAGPAGAAAQPWASPETWRETGVQARINVLSGACLAIGLRFAGSARAEAHETLTGARLSWV